MTKLAAVRMIDEPQWRGRPKVTHTIITTRGVCDKCIYSVWSVELVDTPVLREHSSIKIPYFKSNSLCGQLAASIPLKNGPI